MDVYDSILSGTSTVARISWPAHNTSRALLLVAIPCLLAMGGCFLWNKPSVDSDTYTDRDSEPSSGLDCSSYDHEACGEDGNVYEYAPEGCALAPQLVDECINEECGEDGDRDAYCCGAADIAYCSSESEACMRDSCGNTDASTCQSCADETSCLQGECLSDCTLNWRLSSTSCADVAAVWFEFVPDDTTAMCSLGDEPAYEEREYTHTIPLGETWYLSVALEAWDEGSNRIEECFGSFECDGEDLEYTYSCQGAE